MFNSFFKIFDQLWLCCILLLAENIWFVKLIYEHFIVIHNLTGHFGWNSILTNRFGVSTFVYISNFVLNESQMTVPVRHFCFISGLYWVRWLYNHRDAHFCKQTRTNDNVYLHCWSCKIMFLYLKIWFCESVTFDAEL